MTGPLEPDWVNDYDTTPDEVDPELDRDRREAEAIEDAYNAWVDRQIEDAYNAWVDRQMGACHRDAS